MNTPATTEESSKVVSVFINLEESILAYETRDKSLTPEYLANLGQFIFNAEAINQKDIKLWSIVQEIQLKRDKQAMERQKLDLELEAATAPDKKAASTREETKSAVHKILGIRS